MNDDQVKVVREALSEIERFLREEMFEIVTSTTHLEPRRDFRTLVENASKLTSLRFEYNQEQRERIDALIKSVNDSTNRFLDAIRSASALKADRPNASDAELVQEAQVIERLFEAIDLYTADAKSVKELLPAPEKSIKSKSEKFCFVVMPFEDRRTEIYQEYIKKPIHDELGIACRRADDITRSSGIMQDVWAMLRSCSVVIADLSDRNPNVFYELGLAHAMKKPTVLVSESLDSVPFDLRSMRVVVYGDRPTTWRSLAGRVVKFTRDALA